MEKPSIYVVRSPEADADLVSIWLYGARTWSPAQASAYLLEIEALCNQLVVNPKLGKLRNDLVLGVRSILITPHVIFYRVSKEAIEIVRVLHQREDASATFRQ